MKPSVSDIHSDYDFDQLEVGFLLFWGQSVATWFKSSDESLSCRCSVSLCKSRCSSGRFQGFCGQRRVDGFGSVHQPADAAGEGPIAGAELPAKTQHENHSAAAAGNSLQQRFWFYNQKMNFHLKPQEFSYLVSRSITFICPSCFWVFLFLVVKIVMHCRNGLIYYSMFSYSWPGSTPSRIKTRISSWKEETKFSFNSRANVMQVIRSFYSKRETKSN